jgi:hypothetical protein
MTITYGVSVKGILDQLLKYLSINPNLINGSYAYKPKDISLGDVSLSRKYICKRSENINNILLKMHPIIEEIMLYFHYMLKLLNKLSLPFTWLTHQVWN